jgi:hypothetical protein
MHFALQLSGYFIPFYDKKILNGGNYNTSTMHLALPMLLKILFKVAANISYLP